MFEDLRKTASENFEEYKEDPLEEFDPYDYGANAKPRPKDLFLGMTAVQRFVITLMLLVMSCILATFILVLTGKIYLPFF